jgi:hypothetical protein
MVSLSESVIVVLRCIRSRKTQKRVVERIKACKCLGILDDGSECTNKPTKLGLCPSCHGKASYEFSKAPKVERPAMRQRAIQLGLMLAHGEMGEIKSSSIWKKLSKN